MNSSEVSLYSILLLVSATTLVISLLRDTGKPPETRKPNISEVADKEFRELAKGFADKICTYLDDNTIGKMVETILKFPDRTLVNGYHGIASAQDVDKFLERNNLTRV